MLKPRIVGMLRARALQALSEADPFRKVASTHALEADAGSLAIEDGAPAATVALPGRPPRPELVHAAKVPRRSPKTPAGLAALLHAIAHIEFNAINLALDAAWRFDGMPREFHLDWLRVAAEEALHFSLLQEQLALLGHSYGDFPGHDNMWQMCERTGDDVVARMALVPRTLEARGLDATPQIQEKLRRVGTPAALRAVDVLDVILRDEVGHVAIGNRWFHHLCAQRGLDPTVVYPELVVQYEAPRLRPPFNEAARRAAGFTEAEMAFLLGED